VDAVFDLAAAPVPVRADLGAAFTAVWEHLATPGTWWTGSERVAIAAVARAARSGDPLPEGPAPAATEAAALLGSAPSRTSRAWLEGLLRDGLDVAAYVELVGVVARVTAVDGFHRALDLPLEPLPAARPGSPRREHPRPPARPGRAWVPTVGPPTIPRALSAVPDESAAVAALHGALYLAYDEMGEPDVRRALHRTQMELVAARTSACNECFY